MCSAGRWASTASRVLGIDCTGSRQCADCPPEIPGRVSHALGRGLRRRRLRRGCLPIQRDFRVLAPNICFDATKVSQGREWALGVGLERSWGGWRACATAATSSACASQRPPNAQATLKHDHTMRHARKQVLPDLRVDWAMTGLQARPCSAGRALLVCSRFCWNSLALLSTDSGRVTGQHKNVTTAN